MRTALAHAFDVDLHNFDESSNALSLLQLRAASDAQHSAFPLGRDNPVAGADKDAQMARNYEYPVPAGWRIGYGMGNRTHPTVSPGGYVGQMNAYITHKYVDLNVRTMEQCVAEVQRNSTDLQLQITLRLLILWMSEGCLRGTTESSDAYSQR